MRRACGEGKKSRRVGRTTKGRYGSRALHYYSIIMMGMSILGDSKMVEKIPQNHDFANFGVFLKDLRGKMYCVGRRGSYFGPGDHNFRFIR